MVLVHNHTTGAPEPSEADIAATRAMVEASKIMGIKILDHVIIGDGKYFSFYWHLEGGKNMFRFAGMNQLKKNNWQGGVASCCRRSCRGILIELACVVPVAVG